MAHMNLTSALGSLITGLLGTTFLLFILDGQHFTSAQETKRPQEAVKTSGNAKLIARGKYIVEGVAGCGYCHTPRDENGNPDRSKWLAGAPVFYQPAQRVPVWPTTAPRLATGERGRDDYTVDYLSLAKRPASPGPDASFSHDKRRCGGSRGLPEVA